MKTQAALREEERQAFGDRLNHLMDVRGYPKKARPKLLAQASGLSGEGCRKWIKGLSIPEKANIKALSELLKCREEWLEYGVGAMSDDLNDRDSAILALVQRRLSESMGEEKRELQSLLERVLR